MKRPTKAFSGQEVALFPTMLDVSEPSPSHSPEHSPEPSPSHSPEHSPAPSPTPEHITAAPSQPSPTHPSPTQPSPGAEHHLPTPNESPIHVVHSHGSDEGRLKLNELTDLVTKLFDRIGVLEDDLKKTKQTYSSAFTKLILRVKKLEAQVKIGKARRRARIVHSDDEDIADDSSKQGRILSDAEVQEKASNETEPVIQDVTPTEVIQDQQSSEKGSAEVSTARAKQGTASEEVPIVSTAEENLSTAGGTVTYTQEDVKEVSKESGAKRKKSIPRKITRKRQKLEEDAEKEELKGFLEIIPREEVPMEVESLSTKFSIVDWKTCVLTENFMYYQVFRGDGSSKNYKVLSEMLEDFDRQELYRLVKEKYSASRLEGFGLML
ncbi:hypothetical protein Tco_0356530 [Tanacetum coccineum]